MSIIGLLGPNDLFERAGPPGDARAEKITDPANLGYYSVRVSALDEMTDPPALSQRGQDRRQSGGYHPKGLHLVRP
ncbi:hypothetical protein [Bradyrhizobium japonicum]|uniref:hypothetical protein n=1 Tax=Bradyrhizobium japonicum TaxID=375 RepID=UPI0004BB4468|nr:hypothetical protein [Bradyrhizobium japonicum]